MQSESRNGVTITVELVVTPEMREARKNRKP